jgi:hypothetical protein
MNSFFLVWNGHKIYTPTFQHSTWDSAKDEAKRLALSNPGVTFYVLESKAEVIKSDVEWAYHTISKDDQVPF